MTSAQDRFIQGCKNYRKPTDEIQANNIRYILNIKVSHLLKVPKTQGIFTGFTNMNEHESATANCKFEVLQGVEIEQAYKRDRSCGKFID